MFSIIKQNQSVSVCLDIFFFSKKTKVVAWDFSSIGSVLFLLQLCSCVSESAVICVITEGCRAHRGTELNNSTHSRLVRTEGLKRLKKFKLKKIFSWSEFRGF